METTYKNKKSVSTGVSFKEIALVQEQLEKTQKTYRKLSIGLPKDPDENEKRVMLSPQAVLELTEKGHKVMGESGFGEKSSWSDTKYEASGIEIVSAQRVYEADLILKVSPFKTDEIKLLKNEQTIISALHQNTLTKANIEQLIKSRITAIALELIKESNNFYPFVHSMSEIAGILAIMTGAEYLSSEAGKLKLLGGVTGVPPTEVIIIGAGTAGEAAARTAIGLGASVQVFDHSIERLSELKKNVSHGIYTSVPNRNVLERKIQEADVLIGAGEDFDQETSYLITDYMVSKMKKGSVIVDLNTDTGSLIETSRPTSFSAPTYIKYGVIHYCVPNIASKTSKTSSIALSNTVMPILNNICRNESFASVLQNNTSVRNGIYIYRGILTNKRIANKFKIDFRDIDLISAVL